MSITLTPLAPPGHPPCYLLTVDSAKILLDCGTFDHSPASLPSSSSSSSTSSSPAETAAAISQYLTLLKSLAPTLNLVLLTHPLLTSLGLLPWLKAKCGLRCPVYATLPTREMGRWAVEEWVMARSEEERNEAWEVSTQGKEVEGKKRKGRKREEVVKQEEMEVEVKDDVVQDGEEEKDPWDTVWKVTTKEIRDAFLTVNAVRWTQPVHLSGPLKGYTLVAHRSGHTLGGSLYTLRPSLSSSLSPASSSSSLLYAPIFNHVKEHHLDGAALLNGARIDDAMRRMGVVVVGAERSGMVNVKRVDREKKLLDLITSTLNTGGSILLPTDPSARVLELLVLLESHWNFANLGQKYPLCLISRTGRDVVGFVRSLTEWMGGQIGGEDGGEKVLKFGNLRIYPSLSSLNADIPLHVPKTILTVPSTLSHGFSRELFVEFAKSPNNVVILTGRSEEGSLARWLWGVWNEQQREGEKWGGGKVGEVVQLDETVPIQMKGKIYLSGTELEAHLQSLAEAAELEAKHQAVLERSRRMLHADGDSDSDSDDDGEDADAEEEEATTGEVDGVVPRRRTGGFAGGAGAWDEFLDESTLAGRAGGQSFDIYVKGEYGVRRVMEGLPRFRMFPVVERKRRVDAYGEAIDVEGWLKRGVEDDTFGKPVVAAVLGKRPREEEEAKEVKPEAPHKFVVEEVQAGLFCSLFVVDMEGASDGRALKTILPQINPRKLVVVGGSSEAVTDLSNSCKAISSMTQEIYTPSMGELITVGEETKNFSVRLGDSIMASLRLSRVEDYDVAYVSGVIHFDPESDLPVLERTALTDAIPLSAIAAPPKDEEEEEEDAPTDAEATTTTPPPLQTSSVENLLPPLKPSLFIGDLRLALLKEKLSALNVPSEFAGEGVLVCGPAPPESFGFASASASKVDPRRGAKAVAEAVSEEAAEAAGGRVAVKKTGRGKLVIEGSPGETYFVVRRAVYSLHAAAG
ncbi:beta-lactamase-like protein [Leucosporidium creatinivorum]|uniref:Cleavage and polyadenylation specificity factor subunit 2 n=1 Tax=Leucosporidium creatinivorum TaxID=106004 RepID=A0A1Y2EZ34_9BASI|nr:beta-lactamase-like protein [Leucosporidium creatinivorum]